MPQSRLRPLPLFLLCSLLILAGSTGCGEGRPVAAAQEPPRLADPSPSEPTPDIPPNQALDRLDLSLSLEGDPLLGSTVPLVLEITSKDLEGDIRVQVSLPDKLSLVSGALQWEEVPSDGTASRRALGLRVEGSGFYWVEVDATAATRAGELIRTRRRLYIYQGQPKVSPGNPSPTLDPHSPLALNLVRSPEPVLGQVVHLQAWLYTFRDLSNITFGFTSPPTLRLIQGTNQAPRRHLAAGQAVLMEADLRPVKKGTWEATFNALSKMGRNEVYGLEEDKVVITFNTDGPQDSWINGYQR